MLTSQRSPCPAPPVAFASFHPLSRPLQTNKRQLRFEVNRLICSIPPPSDEQPDPQFSRRVFLAGLSLSTLITSITTYKFFITPDIESDVASRLSSRFPQLFPPSPPPLIRRLPLDKSFILHYMSTLSDTAVTMKLLTRNELENQENEVKRRARDLFFNGKDNVDEQITNPKWLNFVLYARLHAIGIHTNKYQREKFSENVARRLKIEGGEGVEGIQQVMENLKHKGWISDWRVEGFEESEWLEEGRASLTVYAEQLVTMQASMLLAEEEMEDIAPKVTQWLRIYLEGAGVDKLTWEDYYLDDTYRKDPRQYAPSLIATQFDLVKGTT